MPLIRNSFLAALFAICLVISGVSAVCAQTIIGSSEPDTFLGLDLRPEIRSIVREIEQKSKRRISAQFAQLDTFQLGISYIDDDTGVPTIFVGQDLEGEDKKLEAVIVHELLHLRLRVNGFPTFLFSPTIQTAQGRAIDVEQGHVNDLLSIIEHQVFKADMQRFGLYKYIDLAGDTAADSRKRKGSKDGQADAINYARAILEYPDPRDVKEVKQIFEANGWNRSIREGAAIAAIISTGPNTPKDVETVFLRCLLTLYPVSYSNVTFKLSIDPAIRYYRQMTINTAKVIRKRKK